MKKILFILIFIPMVSFANNGSFLYPGEYKETGPSASFGIAVWKKSCTIEDKYIEQINNEIFIPPIYLEGNNEETYGPFGVVEKLDLNNDGSCEVIVSNPVRWGSSGPFYSVQQVHDGNIRNIGDIGRDYWLGESYNDYAQILYPGYFGHKTNASHTVILVRFKGSGYEFVNRPKISYGGYSDLGAKHYKNGDYDKAEMYFLNRYRMDREESLKSANDLAITWFKLGKFREAQLLLEKHIQQKNEPRQLASAYFNLGLIYEANNDITKAINSYTKSNNIKKSPAKTKKINKLLSGVSKIIGISAPLSTPRKTPAFPDTRSYEQGEHLNQSVTPYAKNYAINNGFNPILFEELFTGEYPSKSCSARLIGSVVAMPYGATYFITSNVVVFETLNFSIFGSGRELTAVLFNSQVPEGKNNREDEIACLQGWKLAVFENSKVIQIVEIPFAIDNLLGTENMLSTGLNVEKGRLKVVVEYVLTGSGGWPHQGFVYTLFPQNGELVIEKTEIIDEQPNWGSILCLEKYGCRP